MFVQFVQFILPLGRLQDTYTCLKEDPKGGQGGIEELSRKIHKEHTLQYLEKDFFKPYVQQYKWKTSLREVGYYILVVSIFSTFHNRFTNVPSPSGFHSLLTSTDNVTATRIHDINGTESFKG